MPENGATDSQWRPSWWRWLLSALSGTVEIEKQHAWKMSELKRQTEESKRHELRMNALRRERATSRARIQNRWIVLQIRHLLDPNPETQAAIADFLQFLQEYGEL